MISNGGILYDYAILSNVLDDFLMHFITDHTVNIDELSYYRYREILIWSRTIEARIFDNLDKENELIFVLVHSFFNIIVKQFLPVLESVVKNEK